MTIKLHDLVQEIGAELRGDSDCIISGVATLQNATPGTISFFSNRKYKQYLLSTKASAVILSPEDAQEFKGNAIISQNVYLTYAKVATLLKPKDNVQAGIHESAKISSNSKIDPSVTICANAIIAEHVEIGKGCYIGPGSVIENNVSLGEHVRLVANVVLCHGVKISNRVILHPGVVIGSDGFGIANDKGNWVKVPQLGSVLIGDDVEVGANTTIDRGALEDTMIEEGVKLDNQIQIAHNVRIGAHTAIAGCVGIAGSAIIGRYCGIGGGVGILGHLEIVDRVEILSMSFVTQSITKPGRYSSGTPVQENAIWNKNNARLRKLDELARRVKELERKLEKK